MNQSKSRILTLFFVFIFVLTLLAACSNNSQQNAPGQSSNPAATGGEDGKVYTLRLAAASTPPGPGASFIVALEKFIEEGTNGRIDVQVYHSGTLGTTNQVIQGIQDGSIEGACLPLNYYEPSVPELGIFGLPMFFDNSEQAVRLCSEKGTELNDLLMSAFSEKGFFLAKPLVASNNMFITIKPIEKYEDLKGLKLWCQSNSILVSTLNAFGATPVNFETGDLAVGLQQKTIDGAYANSVLIAPQKLYDMAKNLLVSDVTITFSVHGIIYSKIFIDSLPPDLRDLLLEATLKGHDEFYTPYNTEYIKESYDEIMNAPGVITTHADEEFIAKARAAVASLGDDFIANVPSAKPIYEAAKAAIEADRAS